jgi:hypothetical protein
MKDLSVFEVFVSDKQARKSTSASVFKITRFDIIGILVDDE